MFKDPFDWYHALILELCSIIYHTSCRVIYVLAAVPIIPIHATHDASLTASHVAHIPYVHTVYPAGRSDLEIHSDIINMYSCAFKCAETKLK